MKWSWQWMSFHKNRGVKGQLHNTYWDAFVIQKNYGKHVNNLYEHILTWTNLKCLISALALTCPFLQMKQIICSLEDYSSQLGHSGIHLGGFNIYIIDSGLQKAIHIGQFLTVWSAKDKVNFEKLINTGQWIRSLQGRACWSITINQEWTLLLLGPTARRYGWRLSPMLSKCPWILVPVCERMKTHLCQCGITS